MKLQHFKSLVIQTYFLCFPTVPVYPSMGLPNVCEAELFAQVEEFVHETHSYDR